MTSGPPELWLQVKTPLSRLGSGAYKNNQSKKRGLNAKWSIDFLLYFSADGVSDTSMLGLEFWYRHLTQNFDNTNDDVSLNWPLNLVTEPCHGAKRR